MANVPDIGGTTQTSGTATEDSKRDQGKLQAPVSATQSSNHQNHKGENRNWKSVFNYVRFSVDILTLFFVGWYTLITFNEFHAATIANKISQQALTAETRAWIDLTVDSQALDWSNPTNPSIIAQLTFTNMGNSPALNVTPYLQFVEGLPPINEERVDKICSSFAPKDFGNTIFMKDHMSTSISAITTMADIQNFQARIAQMDHISANQIQFYDPILVVCANYKIIGDDRWHITGRAFAIGEWRKAQDGQSVFIGMPIGTSLPFGVAGLKSVYNGDYTD